MWNLTNKIVIFYIFCRDLHQVKPKCKQNSQNSDKTCCGRAVQKQQKRDFYYFLQVFLYKIMLGCVIILIQMHPKNPMKKEVQSFTKNETFSGNRMTYRKTVQRQIIFYERDVRKCSCFAGSGRI